MDKQTYQQLDRIETILNEIAYEIGIFNEKGEYVDRENREQEENDNEIPKPAKMKTSIKNKKSEFEDEEDELNEED